MKKINIERCCYEGIIDEIALLMRYLEAHLELRSLGDGWKSPWASNPQPDLEKSRHTL